MENIAKKDQEKVSMVTTFRYFFFGKEKLKVKVSHLLGTQYFVWANFSYGNLQRGHLTILTCI